MFICLHSYFATRTHKQITQVVRELRKTAYANRRMTILSSREHTCINPLATAGNKNEFCRAARLASKPADKCSYEAGAEHLARHRDLRPGSRTVVWDIEDLIKLGKKQRMAVSLACVVMKSVCFRCLSVLVSDSSSYVLAL